MQIAIDIGMAASAFLLAFLVRYDGAVPQEQLDLAFWLLPGVVAGKMVVHFLLGNYRQIWQYTGLREVQYLFLGSCITSLLLVGLRGAGVVALPYSIILLDGVLHLFGITGIRVFRRIQVDFKKGRQAMDQTTEATGSNTLLVGAGDTANALLRHLAQTSHKEWRIVGLLDDDPAKQKMQLNGYPVLGPTTNLERMIDLHRVDRVVVALPSAPNEVIRDIIKRAQGKRATVQVAPRMIDLIKNGHHQNGHATNGTKRSEALVTLADLADSAEVKRTLLSKLGRHERENTVLVTGGAGYIGSLLVGRMLEEGYTVRVLDNFTFGYDALRPLFDHPRLEIVEGDIASIRDVVSAVKDVGSVVALAAIVGDPACGLDAEETLTLNYESTKALVEACNFYGVGRLVFASSCSVYGASDNNVLTESSPLNPVSLYARTRILSENVIFDRCGDVAPVVLRLSTVFGLSPRMRYDLVVNALTAHAMVDKRIQIFGGEQQRPFIHCRDAAEAFLQAIKAPLEKVRGEIFNVGGNHLNYAIAEVGRIVAEEVGGVEVDFLSHVEDLRNYRVSFDKFRHQIGFTPAFDLRRGIREMIEAMEAHPHLRDYNNPVFSNLKVMQDLLESANVLAREA